jgi:hypothetical protein
MSDPIVDGPRRAGAGTIVGVALVLMLLSALAAFLIISRGGPIDGAAQLESVFGVRSIGAGYEVTFARKMPGGTSLITFEDRAAAPEVEMKPADPNAKPVKDERFDWSRVPIPAATARPRQVTFHFPEAGESHDAVAEFFRNVERRSLEDLGPDGGKVTIETGKLAWRGFDAAWLHERGFEKGGTFRDAMRVDLSLEKQPCVMVAVWPRGETASKAALEQVLDALGRN